MILNTQPRLLVAGVVRLLPGPNEVPAEAWAAVRTSSGVARWIALGWVVEPAAEVEAVWVPAAPVEPVFTAPAPAAEARRRRGG
jgi:hypothetical protein